MNRDVYDWSGVLIILAFFLAIVALVPILP